MKTSSFLALHENILVYDLLEQNEEICQQLLHITFIFVLYVKQNEKLFSGAAILKNMPEVQQEAFQKTKDKIVEIERNQRRMEQNSQIECFYFSGIPNTVPPKVLESFVIHALEKNNINLNKSQIVACHRLGKSEKTIVKFLNRKKAKKYYWPITKNLEILISQE